MSQPPAGSKEHLTSGGRDTPSNKGRGDIRAAVWKEVMSKPHLMPSPNTLKWTKDVQGKQGRHPCRGGGWARVGGRRVQDLRTGRGLSKQDVYHRKNTDYGKKKNLQGKNLSSQTNDNLGENICNTYYRGLICLRLINSPAEKWAKDAESSQKRQTVL